MLPSINDNLAAHYQSLSSKIFRNRMNFIKLNIIYYFIITILILLISPPPSPKSIIFTRIERDNETLQQQHHQLNYYQIAYYFFKNHKQLFTTTTTTLNKVDATFNFITQQQQQQQPTNRDSQPVQSSSYDQYNNQDQLSSSSNEHNSVLDITQQQQHQQYNSPINSPYFTPSELGSGMNPRTYQNNLYSGVSQSAYSPSSQQFSTPTSSASDSLITVKCVDGNDQDDSDCKLAPSYYSEDSIITPIVIFESSSSSSPSSVLQYSGSRDDNIISTSTLSSYTNLPPSSSFSSRPSLNQDPLLVKTSFVATPRPSHDSHNTPSRNKHKNVNNTTNNTGRQCKDDDDDDCDDTSPDDNDTDDDDEDDDDNDDSNHQTNQNSLDNGSGGNDDTDNDNDYGDDENGDQDYDDQSSGDLDLSSATPISVDQHQSTLDDGDQQSGGTYTTSSTLSSVSSKDVDDEVPSLKPTFQPEQKAEIEVIIHSTMAPRLAIATTTPPSQKSINTYDNPSTEDDNSITSETTYQNKSVWSTSDSGHTTIKGPQKVATQPNGVRKHNSDFGSGLEPNSGTVKTINGPIENQDDDKPFVSYPTLPSISQQDNVDGDNSQMTGSSRQDTVTSEAPQIYATFKPVPMPPNVINTYLTRYYENQPPSSQQQQQSRSNPLDRLASTAGLESMGQSKIPQSRAQSIASRVVPAPINQLRGDKMKQPNPNSLLYIAFGSVIMMLLVVVSLLVYSLYCRPKLGARPGIGAQMVNSNYPIQNTFGSFSKLVPQPVAKNQPGSNYYPANMIVNTKGSNATKTSLATYNGRQAPPTNKKQYSGDDSFSTSYESSRSMDNLNGNSQYRRDGNNYPQTYNTMRPQREGVYNTAGQQAPPLAPKPQLQVRHQVDSAGRVYNDYSQQGVLINGLMVNKKNDGADGRKSSEWYV